MSLGRYVLDSKFARKSKLAEVLVRTKHTSMPAELKHAGKACQKRSLMLECCKTLLLWLSVLCVPAPADSHHSAQLQPEWLGCKVANYRRSNSAMPSMLIAVL